MSIGRKVSRDGHVLGAVGEGLGVDVLERARRVDVVHVRRVAAFGRACT